MKIQKACSPPCLSLSVVSCCCCFDSTQVLFWDQRQRNIMKHTYTGTCGPGGCEEGAKEAKSSEPKVTVVNLLCRTIDSLWPCFHSCPPFPHGRCSALFPLLFVPGCRSRSSSHALTLPRSLYSHSLLASILVNLLSPPTASRSIRLAAPPLLRCPILAASSSLPHPRCLILAASPSLPHPRCLTLAVSSSLPYPCCPTLAPTPHLRTPHIADFDQPPFAGAPISSNFGHSFLRCYPFSCLHHVFRAVSLLGR
jgi:hypothetical protein